MHAYSYLHAYKHATVCETMEPHMYKVTHLGIIVKTLYILYMYRDSMQ